MERLIWAEGVLLVVVLLVMPMYAVWASIRRGPGTEPRLKGLALPEGSIRGMLALMSVGSFVILLVLGPGAPEMREFFDKALAAFGTLTGAIIGFYFGNRGTAAANTAETSVPEATTTSATTVREATTGPIADPPSPQSAGLAPSTTQPE